MHRSRTVTTTVVYGLSSSWASSAAFWVSSVQADQVELACVMLADLVIWVPRSALLFVTGAPPPAPRLSRYERHPFRVVRVMLVTH